LARGVVRVGSDSLKTWAGEDRDPFGERESKKKKFLQREQARKGEGGLSSYERGNTYTSNNKGNSKKQNKTNHDRGRWLDNGISGGGEI